MIRSRQARCSLLGCLWLLAACAWAQAERESIAKESTAKESTASTELELLAEYPIEGIAGGNLSGLSWCGNALWAVSDRDDDRIYRLDTSATPWQAKAEIFAAPPAPDSGLPWNLRMGASVRGFLFGVGQEKSGALDFEGLACDAQSNRYLVSESRAAVLRLGSDGGVEWLALPPSVVEKARDQGLLIHFNALYEGIAVDHSAGRLWLAAERQSRGLLLVHRQSPGACSAGCVLLSEGEKVLPPPALGDKPLFADFSALDFYRGKLYTLERLAHRICRRDGATGALEKCWSFAATALVDQRRYDTPYGMAEALWISADGALVGVDNNGDTRRDGEQRPIVWRFATPKNGW